MWLGSTSVSTTRVVTRFVTRCTPGPAHSPQELGTESQCSSHRHHFLYRNAQTFFPPCSVLITVCVFRGEGLLCPLLVASQRGSDQPHPRLPSWALSDGLKLSRGQTWYHCRTERPQFYSAATGKPVCSVGIHFRANSRTHVARIRAGHVTPGPALQSSRPRGLCPQPSPSLSSSEPKPSRDPRVQDGILGCGGRWHRSPRLPVPLEAEADCASGAKGLPRVSSRILPILRQSSPPQRRGDPSTERARDLLGVTQPVRAGTGPAVPLHTRAFAHAILLRAHCASFRVRTTDFSSATRF